MASIETVDFNIYKDVQANVSYIVGAGEKNERNDVLLIQSLFNLVGYSDYYARKNLGLPSKELPEPTGICDAKTIRAIWAFQQKSAHRLRNIDGKIHPASYENRVLKKGPQARQMSITLLNLLAQDGALMTHNGDVISTIKKISPSIVFV